MKEKMTYEEFKEEITKRINEFLPEELKGEIRIKKRYMNNMSYDSIYIGTGDKCLGLPLYFYFGKMEREHLSFNEVISLMIEDRKEYAEKLDSFLEVDISNLELITENIFPRLISKKKNEKYLSDKPYKCMADLAIIYVIEFKKNNEFWSSVVTDELLKTWNVCQEEIEFLALQNMKRQENYMFDDMTKIARIPGCNLSGIYVLGNKNYRYGSSTILDAEYMDKVAAEIGNSFMIIPSSVHELLLIPYDNENIDFEEIRNAVPYANEKVVAENEILSDNSYEYDFKYHVLKVV